MIECDKSKYELYRPSNMELQICTIYVYDDELLTTLSARNQAKELIKWQSKMENADTIIIVAQDGESHCICFLSTIPSYAVRFYVSSSDNETSKHVNKLQSYFCSENPFGVDNNYTNNHQYINNELTGCAYPRCDIGARVMLKYCSRCKSVRYCSKEHQKDHWNIHKFECTPK